MTAPYEFHSISNCYTIAAFDLYWSLYANPVKSNKSGLFVFLDRKRRSIEWILKIISFMANNKLKHLIEYRESSCFCTKKHWWDFARLNGWWCWCYNLICNQFNPSKCMHSSIGFHKLIIIIITITMLLSWLLLFEITNYIFPYHTITNIV